LTNNPPYSSLLFGAPCMRCGSGRSCAMVAVNLTESGVLSLTVGTRIVHRTRVQSRTHPRTAALPPVSTHATPPSVSGRHSAYLQCESRLFRSPRLSSVCLSRVRSRKLSEVGSIFRRFCRISGSPSKNITSDFAPEVAKYPKVAPNPQIAQVGISITKRVCETTVSLH